MMKKMTSMLLALAMCLTLSVPAFAAEEEPELTTEPAVQTEVETEPVGESAARDICRHTSVRTDYYNEVEYGNYDDFCHVVKRMKHETCLLCEADLGTSFTGETSTERHRMQVSEYGTVIGSNGETVITYLHACILCGYHYLEP
ncbi:MAG: hypothetical protein J6J87_10520 [Oscillospiraceae bacterium]|nr:hypothetical protein [Oscillospiraceae bacterium]